MNMRSEQQKLTNSVAQLAEENLHPNCKNEIFLAQTRKLCTLKQMDCSIDFAQFSLSAIIFFAKNWHLLIALNKKREKFAIGVDRYESLISLKTLLTRTMI